MRHFPITLSLCFVLFTFLSPQLAHAQREQLPKWETRLGIGLLPTFAADEVKSIQPPLFVEMRYRPLKNISVGLLAGQSISRGVLTHHTGSRQVVTNRYRSTALRLAAHSNPWERWEIYGGLVFSYSHNHIEYIDINTPKEQDNFMPKAPIRNGLLYTAFLGGSMKISDHLKVFGELGFGLSIVSTGVSYRF